MSKEQHKLYDEEGKITQDRPWIFRTYGGHTNAKATNNLFRENLAKGQTGLSIAFDLPTQCGYSSDDPIALPEVGRVGVPINSLEDFRVLFQEIPIEKMNTSMTINGTAMWLLSLYIALAEEKGVPINQLNGTTQNDIIKEYLARGTYIFPPDTSMNLIVDMYEYCLKNIPKWNPSNICSYHLQEAGATPVEELAFSLATAMNVLDSIQSKNCLEHEDFERVVGRISFFVNSGMRFVEEMCKMIAFVELWDEITSEKYKVKNSKYRRFRYGVQVNSLGLTEEQPENNAWRILIETLAVTLSRKARCRALQLPAWNEALSLPRPWDQQWSLRLQQVLAYETDLLEYPDLFEGSPVIQSKVKALKKECKKELDIIEEMGGAIEAIKSGYMKNKLVTSNALRMSKIMTGETVIVGRNKFTEGLSSPLVSDQDSGILKVDTEQTKTVLNNLKDLYKRRDKTRVEKALKQLEEDARTNKNLMPASIECAKSLVTTGEWSQTLKKVFGAYRPITGVEGQTLTISKSDISTIRDDIEAFVQKVGYRPKFLVAKPGLDGHSNGAELTAIAAKNCGFDVIYSGIRLSIDEIIETAIEEDVNILGISLLSGSHLEIVSNLMELLKESNVDKRIPVVVGGIIPKQDWQVLRDLGIQRIFTPKDFNLLSLMKENFEIIKKFNKIS